MGDVGGDGEWCDPCVEADVVYGMCTESKISGRQE